MSLQQQFSDGSERNCGFLFILPDSLYVIIGMETVYCTLFFSCLCYAMCACICVHIGTCLHAHMCTCMNLFKRSKVNIKYLFCFLFKTGFLCSFGICPTVII